MSSDILYVHYILLYNRFNTIHAHAQRTGNGVDYIIIVRFVNEMYTVYIRYAAVCLRDGVGGRTGEGCRNV